MQNNKKKFSKQNMISTMNPVLLQSAFRPADWKTQGSPETWNQMSTDVAIDIPVDLPSKFQSSSVLKQIQVSAKNTLIL